MSVKVENLENSMAKLTVEVEASKFDKALNNSYNKNKSKFSLPGFRQGKAPRAMIEKMYGQGVFFEDAFNEILDETYPDAVKESGLDIVSRPEIGLEKIKKGENLIYTATVAVRPEVTLGEYKGVEVKKADTNVKPEEIEEKIKAECEKNSRTIEVERPVCEKDIAVIDFTGYVDEKEFEGGKGEDYPLTIGSGTFIPGFEDQLIGLKAGDEKDVNVTFPEEYGAKNLAGKKAVFKVTVKSVKEKQIPEANDEFASEVSEFDTLEEYKKDLEKQLKQEKERKATTENENNVVDRVCENASVTIPGPMLETQLDRMFYDYSRRLESQGIPMDQYMKYTGLDEEKIKEQMKPNAEKQLKTGLVLDKIAKEENITAADERVEDEFKKIADQYKMTYEDLMKTVDDSQKEKMRQDIVIQETVDFLVSEAKLV